VREGRFDATFSVQRYTLQSLLIGVAPREMDHAMRGAFSVDWSREADRRARPHRLAWPVWSRMAGPNTAGSMNPPS